VNDITQLDHATLNGGDEITIDLIRPNGLAAISRTVTPSKVRITWPLQATVINAREFSEIAAVVARLFAGASTELPAIRDRTRYL